jgi:hypothetical protein
MRANRLVVNGREVEYQPLGEGREDRPAAIVGENLDGRPHRLLLTPGVPSRSNFGPVKAPEGRYFLMGDNRDLSFGSRYFGFVEPDRIVGRALAVIVSLDPDRHYTPRRAGAGSSRPCPEPGRHPNRPPESGFSRAPGASTIGQLARSGSAYGPIFSTGIGWNPRLKAGDPGFSR